MSPANSSQGIVEAREERKFCVTRTIKSPMLCLVQRIAMMPRASSTRHDDHTTMQRRPKPTRLYLALIVRLIALIALVVFVLSPWWEAIRHNWVSDLDEPLPKASRAQLNAFQHHLQQPFHGYTRYEVLETQFGIVALSHMAIGLMNIATADESQRPLLIPMIDEIARRAISAQASPMHKDLDEVKALGDHGLYLSHTNLILGIHKHITQGDRYDKLQTRLSRHLAGQSLVDGDYHARSYPLPEHLKQRKGAHKWPADQAVLINSVWLYDQQHKKDLSKKLIKGWLTHLDKHLTDEVTSLPLPTLDEKASYAKYPRGCALSWTLFHMAQFAPKEAAALYERYRNLYSAEVVGFGGFREWPPGLDRGADVDSGPVILGVGTAASGLGLGPARLFKDARQYAMIQSTASTFGFPTVWSSTRRYPSATLLGESIMFSASTARGWFQDPPTPPLRESPVWPFGTMILFFIGSTLAFTWVSSTFEDIKRLRSW